MIDMRLANGDAEPSDDYVVKFVSGGLQFDTPEQVERSLCLYQLGVKEQFVGGIPMMLSCAPDKSRVKSMGILSCPFVLPSNAAWWGVPQVVRLNVGLLMVLVDVVFPPVALPVPKLEHWYDLLVCFRNFRP